MGRHQRGTEIVAGSFPRPSPGYIWQPPHPIDDLPLGQEPAWQSNGGPYRGHYARSLPHSFEIRLPDQAADLKRIHILGVFALYADSDSEGFGTVGATIQLYGMGPDPVARYDLVNGRHYGDAKAPQQAHRIIGDGTSLETVGTCDFHGEDYRVDLLTIDMAASSRPKRFLFRALGSSASFVVFDVFFEFEISETCPFRARSGGVSLAELGTAIRVGDRVKFGKALEQLDHAVDEAEDLDEARGLSLTFFAVVTAALLESGNVNRTVHRHQLEFARELERLRTRADIRDAAQAKLRQMTDGLFAPSESHSDRLVDRALAIVERNYAKELTDAIVAAQLGLSTSHFRFLFRQATGSPFHKYVVAVRLEKAKQMLVEQELPISQIATAVGFTGLSHFSRAFAQRFSASPSHIRRAAG